MAVKSCLKCSEPRMYGVSYLDKENFISDVTAQIEKFKQQPSDSDFFYSIYENSNQTKIRLIFNTHLITKISLNGIDKKIESKSLILSNVERCSSPILQKIQQIMVQYGFQNTLVVFHDTKPNLKNSVDQILKKQQDDLNVFMGKLEFYTDEELHLNTEQKKPSTYAEAPYPGEGEHQAEVSIRNLVIDKSVSDAALLRLIELHREPIESGCLEYALIHRHSDPVILSLIEKTLPQEVNVHKLDTALCDNPSPAIVNRLIAGIRALPLPRESSPHCKIDSDIIDRALCGKDLKGDVTMPDEVVLAVIDAFDVTTYFDSARLLNRAISHRCSNEILTQLLSRSEETSSQLIEEARAAGYPKEIIDELKRKCTDPSSCTIL